MQALGQHVTTSSTERPQHSPTSQLLNFFPYTHHKMKCLCFLPLCLLTMTSKKAGIGSVWYLVRVSLHCILWISCSLSRSLGVTFVKPSLSPPDSFSLHQQMHSSHPCLTRCSTHKPGMMPHIPVPLSWTGGPHLHCLLCVYLMDE